MDEKHLTRQFWTDLGGDPSALDGIQIGGPRSVLPSIYDVTGFATSTVAAAAAAVAELAFVRDGGTGSMPQVRIDRLSASASFRFEALLAPDGWQLPPIWDPVAGDYETADGWIRLHTNYRHHLDGVLAVLGVAADRSAVADEVPRWKADELESAVVSAGGCAAAMRTADEWAVHPAGQATAFERPVVIGAPVPFSGGTGPDLSQPAGAAPLAGIRVLDLTRVIAGPVATRYLAAYGADVLRIDPPGFEEVPALMPESTAGKRCAFLDLHADSDRSRFEALVAQAHVVVGGFRPGALAGLGYGPNALRSINPSLITVNHDAYGWSGPWADRRGFDSLVQMSTGITAAGAVVAGTDRPTPLPAQALDHGIGHLLAAATCRALTRLITDGVAADVRASLVGAANVVKANPASPGAWSPVPVIDAHLESGETHWGHVHRVPLAGWIEGIDPSWPIPSGPLGRHKPTFA